MKLILILFFLTLSSNCIIGQKKIISFPLLSEFTIPDFAQQDNIFPIALIEYAINDEIYRIPISYSLLHDSIDSSNFFIKGDFINNYSFKILENGKCTPLFKKETLILPSNWTQFLSRARNKFDSAKSKINLANYLKFFLEPEWWQDDATPLCEDGSPMKFICQIELGNLTTDDCCLYIFLDKKRKLVKQIYQRD